MRKRRTQMKTLSPDEGAALADRLDFGPLGTLKPEGARLTGKVRLWRRTDGRWTGRFVFRSDDGMSLTYTIRGLSLS